MLPILFAISIVLPTLNSKKMMYSIFAISIGAYMGASNEVLTPLAEQETWDMLRLARSSFGDECRRSPSLSVMAESMRVALAGLMET
jgi:hypothetical protein